jgi:hypothetical protein
MKSFLFVKTCLHDIRLNILRVLNCSKLVIDIFETVERLQTGGGHVKQAKTRM